MAEGDVTARAAGSGWASFDVVSADELRRNDQYKWTLHGTDLLGADAAEMDFGTAPAVSEALVSAVQRGVLGYVPPRLERKLAEACAAWQGNRYGWRIAADDVKPLPDVIRALHVAIENFSRPGSPVIVPTPAYMPFLVVPRLLGREVIEVEMVPSEGRYRYDLDALDRAYRAGGDLLLLCNPHNPSGHVLEREELLALSRLVDRHGGRVFADEIHAPLVMPGSEHIPYASVSEAAARQALTAVSASKAWNLAGLKCAQMILSNDADRERWAGLGRLATDGTSILGVIAATTAFRHGGPWLDEVCGYLSRNRAALAELLAEELPGVNYRPPEGTYLAWLDFRGVPLPTLELAEFFLRTAGVTVVDGTDCGTAGRGFVRLNFATSQAILAQIVRRMSGAVTASRREPAWAG
ncbi:MalY/PatB family protein [Streptomyces sp. NPDC004096]